MIHCTAILLYCNEDITRLRDKLKSFALFLYKCTVKCRLVKPIEAFKTKCPPSFICCLTGAERLEVRSLNQL